jgi:mono/diheme cytochrome c family protein
MTNPTSSSPPERTALARRARGSGAGCAIAVVVLLVGGVVAAVLWLPRLVDQLAVQAGTAPITLDDYPTAAQVRMQRAGQSAQLEGYGWVDQEAGVAHVPIARAMALVAEQGLPVAGTASESGSAADEPLFDPEMGQFLVDPAVMAPPAEEPAVDLNAMDLTNVTYQEHVLPIFERHCAECHGADDPEEGLELTRYRTAMNGSIHGPVIEPGDPDNSYLVEQIVSGQMPKRGEPLSPAEIEIIIAWIATGAPEE